MIEIKKDFNLKKFNTFGVNAKARFFVEIFSEEELAELFLSEEFKNNRKFFLGGGSNVLFTEDFDGILILNKIKGISIVKENEEYVFVKSMSGEIWNDLVDFCVEKKYWGIENLALIPGTVGGAPMQNIGAYGVEFSNIVYEVEVYDIEINKKIVFKQEECKFGYRTSIFKETGKEKYFISSVILKLSKVPKVNISYKVLKEYIDVNNIKVSSPSDISNSVSSIRRSKLPDPLLLGNAGSFFKNIFLDKKEGEEFLRKHPNVPFFIEDEMIKIPSAFLIESCGWKGKRIGNIGVHDKQALVLVNYGEENGKEIKMFSEKIIEDVFQKFGLKLLSEVNLI